MVSMEVLMWSVYYTLASLVINYRQVNQGLALTHVNVYACY